jgi:hypothetical protein
MKAGTNKTEKRVKELDFFNPKNWSRDADVIEKQKIIL